MKALTFAKTPIFASALLTLILFAVVHPNRVNAATVHHRVNVTEETRQSADDFAYTPPDSPGSHREFDS